MRILVLGATGAIGQQVVAEALQRQHQLTAVSRHPVAPGTFAQAVHHVQADVSDPQAMARLCEGQDLVINATRTVPGRESDIQAMTQGLLQGMANSGIRLLVVGGAASLTVPGTRGRLLIDDPRYLPPSWREVAQASLDQYRLYQAETRVDWTYLSPPAQLEPGPRTGQFRTGSDELLVDREGRSRISIADLAMALLDEAEQPRLHRSRFTVAY